MLYKTAFDFLNMKLKHNLLLLVYFWTNESYGDFSDIRGLFICQNSWYASRGNLSYLAINIASTFCLPYAMPYNLRWTPMKGFNRRFTKSIFFLSLAIFSGKLHINGPLHTQPGGLGWPLFAGDFATNVILMLTLEQH